jgi:hypothetical protein
MAFEHRGNSDQVSPVPQIILRRDMELFEKSLLRPLVSS